jgi:hypothetical protein
MTVNQFMYGLMALSLAVLAYAFLAGCTQLGLLSTQPTPAQIQSCYGYLTIQAGTHALSSAQLTSDELQLKGTPPVMPADCAGHY